MKQWNGYVSIVCLVVGIVLASAPGAWATSYTWNITTGGLWSANANWATSVNNPALDYPTNAGDTAYIWNTLPVVWPNGTSGRVSIVLSTITIDTNTINGLNLNMRDDDTGSTASDPHNIQLYLYVNANAAFNRIDWYNDINGYGRSYCKIANGKTLSVNYLNMTGRFPDTLGGVSGGTLQWTPDANGNATYGYFGGTEQMGSSVTYDHTLVTSMIYTQNGGGAYLEGRDVQWKVGNALTNQTWTVTGGKLLLQQRSTGNPWHFYKSGTNDVDMGKRTGVPVSDGVKIQRTSNAGASGSQRNLFTDTGGNATGGTVKIADYVYSEDYDNTSNHRFTYDKVGANLLVTAGGGILLYTMNSASYDDVNVLWVLTNRTVTVQGTNSIVVNDIFYTNSTGRMGISFAGATLSSEGSLKVMGSNTFLNGGVAGGTMLIASNVIVQSQNASGFTNITSLPAGFDATADDFDLRSSRLIMNGGGRCNLSWTPGLTHSEPGALQANSFGITNFTLGTLAISNNTTLTLSAGTELYLGSNLWIETGSSLVFLGGTGLVHVADADMSEVSRLRGYTFDSRIVGARIVRTPGVGFTVTPPEPSLGTLMILK